MGVRGAAIRGDFLIYIMSGIFLYLTHIKSIGAVMGAEGPASPMMQHAPMNTIIAILSGALGALYVQVLSLFWFSVAYHVAWTPVNIDQPVNAFLHGGDGMVYGCSLGLVFLAFKPWFPAFVAIVSQLYQRANMLASGKMFVANTLPSFMLAMFDWNPLFHAIDQARGFAFINYNPRYSELGICVLGCDCTDHDRVDGRVLYPQTCLAQLERTTLGLFHNPQGQVDPPALGQQA